MTSTAINVVRCRRRHKELAEQQDTECCSTSEPACSPTCDQYEEEEEDIPLSTRIPTKTLPCRHQPTRRSQQGMPPEEHRGRSRMTSFLNLSPFQCGVLLLLCTVLQQCSASAELRCGPIDIRNKPWGYRPLYSTVGDPNTFDHMNKSIVDCTVVEGSFSLSFIYASSKKGVVYTQKDYPRFPKLREITGSLLVFETSGLNDLSWVFPNLRVIGGQSLIQHYSLIIYRNHDLHTMGLNNLRVIRNGGVRIMDNKLLCYTKTIDWKSIIMSSINDVTIDDAAEWAVQETGKICPAAPCVSDPTEKKCMYMEQKDGRVQSCWGPDHCMKPCPYDRIAHEGNRAGPGCSPDGRMCHDECIGGCDVPDDATACYACKNLHYKGKCVPKCEDHMYVLLDRRCVTKSHCLSMNPMQRLQKIHIKATAGICSDKCPKGYEQHPTNPKECRKCDGVCEISCAGDFLIDTFPKALAIRRCNIIEGNLTVEIRGNSESGMATELNNVFSSIHTIKGYLRVMRSPPFLTLHMFKNLKRIEGQWLFQNEYVLTLIENTNLRRLFDETSNVTIGRGKLQFHNNRMLCFKQIRELMTRLGKKHEMDDNDQSPSSNGDKAICVDSNIEVRLVSFGHDHFELSWPEFNTTDIDHRKFLGYEVFYKIVPKPDPTMSIDDDRSACVDSWSSMFIAHKDIDKVAENRTITATMFTEQRIRPHTTYAYYVATQMVHHAGAKNGISKIGFVTTNFWQPDAPVVTVSKVEADAIEIMWDPPSRPNGVITHYQLIWREIDVDAEAEGEIFCNQDHMTAAAGAAAYTQAAGRESDMDDDLEEDPLTTLAPSLTSMIPGAKNTCSAIAGCCACGAVPLESVANEADEAAQFENDLLNDIFTPKCDEDTDSLDCILEMRPPELENLDEEEDEGDTPEMRVRRASEAFERQRRRFYRRVHAIRTAGERALQQQFTALILDSSRKRRAIQSASRVSDMADKQRVTSRPVVLTTTAGPDETESLLSSNSEDEEDEAMVNKSKPVIHEEKLYAAEKFEKNITAKDDNNRYNIINLKHFTAYSISISACQDTTVRNNYCSPGMKAAKRKHTKPLMNIDQVDNSTIRFVFVNKTNTVQILWDKIQLNKTNGGIKGYTVTLHGKDGRTPQHSCEGARKGWSPEVNGTTFVQLADGHYMVSVIAYSMYGKGEPALLSKPLIVYTPGFWTWERLGVIFTFTFCVIFVVGLMIYYYIRKFYGKKVKAMADFMQSNPEYCVDNLYKQDEWEIPKEMIVHGEQCGEGSFGRVLVGQAFNFTSVKGITFGPCAIKINLDDPTNPENMNYLMEANIMKQFETEFIVKLYGVVSTVQPAWVVMELMEFGNLRDYLRSKRDDEVFNEMDCEYYDVIPREKFHEWAAQIADGMAYLESVKFCHRDLAARNCMINEHETVKIGDFGMARDLFYHDYYKPSGKRMMPVRWMAPESLKDGKFDSKSDAWSFGIVLYEMMTLGAQPYIGLSNDEVLNYIGMSRKIIKKPECCSSYWYKIMKMCWRYTPRERPTFAQLVHLLALNASPDFRSRSHVINDVNAEVEALDLEQIDIFDGPAEIDVTPDNERRHTDSIQMREFKPTLDGVNSHSTLSVTDDSARGLTTSPPKRLGSLDDDYALMTASGRGGFEQTSDTEVRNFSGEGDYVERDVQIDVPTRRNTGASNSSYGTPYCLSNRGNSNERAGFGEGVRLTDGIGSGQLDDGEYAEKDSMDTRRSTGASTNSYGIPNTNWSSKTGTNFFNPPQRPQPDPRSNGGRGDRLTHLPGTGHLQNTRGGPGEYNDHKQKNGSPSRNGNGPYCQSNRGSFNGRSGFGEHERLTEDSEHPLA